MLIAIPHSVEVAEVNETIVGLFAMVAMSEPSQAIHHIEADT